MLTSRLSLRFFSKFPGSRWAHSFARNAGAVHRPFFAWGVGVTVVASVHLALKPAMILDTAVKTPTVAAATPETVVDPATNIEFPKTLKIGATVQIPPLSLVGVGVRTVSFLGIKVYSVGFYADLRNPNLKFTPSMTPEEKIQHIIENTHCLLRIVPTRNTNYTHLRDSFVRAMHARINAAKGLLPDAEALENSIHIGKLKTLFPNTPLTKHTPLDIFLPAPEQGKTRVLIFRDLGAIENSWIAQGLVAHYFDGKAPSPPMKESVLKSLENTK